MNGRNIRSINRNRERKRKLFCLSLIIFVFAGATSLFLLSRHYLRVNEIVIYGGRHLKNEEVRAFLRVRQGDPLFAVTEREMFDRLRKSPWIKDAAIRREPSGRLLVKVEEETPVAILSYASSPYLVADDGTVLEKLKESTFFLPVIKDIDPYRNVGTFREAVALVKLLRSREIIAYEGTVEVSGQRPEELTLKVDNVHIKIGAGDFEKKLQRLLFVKEEIEKRDLKVEYIDLRFINKVVVRQVNHDVTALEQ